MTSWVTSSALGARRTADTVQKNGGAAFLHDALQDRAERLLDLLLRRHDAALDQPAALLNLLLEGLRLRLEILDLARLDVGREDGGLLLELRSLRLAAPWPRRSVRALACCLSCSTWRWMSCPTLEAPITRRKSTIRIRARRRAAGRRSGHGGIAGSHRQ